MSCNIYPSIHEMLLLVSKVIGYPVVLPWTRLKQGTKVTSPLFLVNPFKGSKLIPYLLISFSFFNNFPTEN